MELKGNVESLKKSVIDEIEQLYNLEISPDNFLPYELAEKLAHITDKINREIAVFINRRGSIVDISVGDSAKASIPDLETRRDMTRLSGIRCIHTHPGGDARLSPVDISSLLKLRLDAMVALGVREGRVNEIYAALPERDETGIFARAQVYGPLELSSDGFRAFLGIIRDIDKPFGNMAYDMGDEEEKAILVGLETLQGRLVNGMSEGQRSLEELEELANTAGVRVVHKILQKRPSADSAFYIGSGMAESINVMRQAINANMVIFDDALSGAQVRNLENTTGVKVIDRTVLILDIFAQRARSREGKLQVELAQLKYRLPRLTGLGTVLSRLGGGIGTRGPGEKKLETDRRHIGRRMRSIERELKEIGKRREMLRESRKKDAHSTIALVGYTNAGKSTLMNKLCDAQVFAEDKLFATLDPTVRRLKLEDGREAMLIDTVGFIRKLPHELVEAFKSTLEEAVYADALIHVIDISSSEAEVQISVVNELLDSLGAMNKPVIEVLNKADLADGKERPPISGFKAGALEVSALTGQGIDKLKENISRIFPKEQTEIKILAPYSEGWILPFVHENGRVVAQKYEENGILINAIIKTSNVNKIREYLVGK
ncbi:GTPase HflX [Anaerobacterium chartisolvens]|uniref:GTPase HflX n=1 Tax=Anaerobacterium chartisolvens TaxID=1297424 RepID=UPI001FA93ED8|nr:GTPase HflX [Anaerobacterium chartisolvens]